MGLRKLTVFWAGLIGFALMHAPQAVADSIPQTQFIAAQSVPFTQMLTFNRYDPSLGALNSIIITGTATILAEVDIFNFHPTPGAFFNAQASVPVSITSDYGLSTSYTGIAGPVSGTAAPGETSFPGISSTNNFPSVTVALVDYGNWIMGPTTATVNLDFSSPGASVSGLTAPGVTVGGSGSAGGSVTVTYNYTPVSGPPVPLPTAASAGACLFGLLGVARIRRHLSARKIAA